MSNDFVSQQLTIPSNQMSQLQPISSILDSSIRMGPGNNDFSPQQFSMSDMQMMPLGSGSNASQQLQIPNIQTGLLETVSSNPGLQNLSMANMHRGQMEPQGYNLVAQQILLPNKQSGEMETMLNNVGSQQLSMLSKRKAPMEPLSSNYAPQIQLPNKRVAQVEHRPWLQQISPPNKRSVQMQPVSNTQGSQNLQAPNKKMVRLESIPKKSGPVAKHQTAQMQPSPKAQTDSSESVRSKMRESLAAALAFNSQQQDKTQNLEKRSQSEAASTEPTGSASAAADAVDHVSEEPKGTLPSNEYCSAQKCTEGQSTSQEAFGNGSTVDSTNMPKCDGLEFQSSFVLPDEDVSFSDSFFAKDELLQGNGLSWVLDPDTEVAVKREYQTAEKQNLDNKEVGGDVGEQAGQSPQILAFEIEAELFKLFGGVNKKYKERGRSLLFNLKDRSNPELRERVMSGDIPPERLCSMTAEELASKELSEWRMAKAEELAQMVVLPDSEVDVRRLVKKTHKGEFQVEVGQQDSVAMEVSVGSSSFTQNLPKMEKEAASPSKPDEIKADVNAASEKNNLEEDVITIPSNEGNDLMQGLMVDDALKDAEFLPPIVSLDEFMESLNSEPPFENLPPDTGTSSPITDKDDSEVGSQSKSPDVTPEDHVDTTPDKPSHTDVANSDGNMKSIDNHVKSETKPPVGTSKGEHVWEGLLQLNISAVTSVIGIFKSGEKAPAKEWPALIEIKGRVRLDAFEKFLQELRMSRSRAIMVVHFGCKEVSTESERASLHEVADSYVLDGRVGFAEPAPGVELYFCPPHTKTLEILSKVLAKDQIDAVNAIDNGLIGVIVWRKVQITSTISPNSASHHKHSSKKQHFTSRRHQEKDTNNNVNLTSKHPMPQSGRHTYPKPPPDDDDDDDVPPGFGPAAARDDDDLPEFNFSGGSTGPQYSTQNPSQGPGMAPFHSHSQTSRPVDQMRELIQKYGQPKTSASLGNWQDKRGTGVPIQPWNDDDDDDIPEWQPQATHPSAPVHSVQQPVLRAHMVNQVHGRSQQVTHQPTAMHVQPPVNVIQGQQQGTWWAPPPGSHGLPPVCQPGGEQFYGAPGLGAGRPGVAWHQDAPKSRGF